MPYGYRNLQEFIAALEKAGELQRIKASVSRDLEISQITDLASKSPRGGKALLFERVVESPFPVLTNAFGYSGRPCAPLRWNGTAQISKGCAQTPSSGFRSASVFAQNGKKGAMSGGGVCGGAGRPLPVARS